MIDWRAGAAEAIANFNTRKRVYPSEFALLLVDFLVERQVVKVEELHRFLTSDFVETTLGHVTTPIHGPGPVPKVEGWYSRDHENETYRINPEFAEAWKIERRKADNG
ncbi:MAG: hypothetical protein J0H17_11010 [Rhizobiales bacterium]|nr:hypothetical protein [Hyphomicrobiales bacterium]